jgi:hypothetical protein
MGRINVQNSAFCLHSAVLRLKGACCHKGHQLLETSRAHCDARAECLCVIYMKFMLQIPQRPGFDSGPFRVDLYGKVALGQALSLSMSVCHCQFHPTSAPSHRQLNTVVPSRTNGRSLGTCKQRVTLSNIGGSLDRKVLSN